MNGKTLGHYRVGEQLGRGGMGEVYVADDLNLNRKVALKFLPNAFATDPERMARFEREAKLLASLNHPNIAAIYGLEQAEGKRFLVLELVEGETLAQRIGKGAMPLDEALGICRQIAEGLEAAHEKGVIHRDLKPANVMVSEGDKVKILDFGLAKALSDDSRSVDSSQSPTLTDAMTQPGVILGTAAYMSPEQAKGKSVDKRADIWAFGCILYECLTGKRAFEGETVTETLAAILKSEPDWNLLPRNTPATIRTLLNRCLNRDSRDRQRDIGESRIVIAEYLANPAAQPTPAVTPVHSRNYWMAAAILLFLMMAGLLFAYLNRKEPERELAQFSISLPEKTILNTTVSISPDGRILAFAAKDETGKSQLWTRPINSLVAKAIPGTMGAARPFWSPDSRSIGFFDSTKLKRVDFNGGSVQTICDAGGGGSWNSAGVIVTRGGAGGSFGNPLCRVAAAGGMPVGVVKLQEGQFFLSQPWFLPDDRHFLYYSYGRAENSGVFVADLSSGNTKRLFAADSAAEFAPPNYLLFVRQGVLWAQEFDLKKLETIGDPKPVAEQVSFDSYGSSHFSVSNTGILAYAHGASLARDVRLVWVDRSGKEVGHMGQAGGFSGVELSPDGKRLAVHQHDGNGGDIRIFDSQHVTPMRLTFDASQDNSSPIWSPDGKRLAFGSVRGGMQSIYVKSADGTGEEELLLQFKEPIEPMSWSPDSRLLVFWKMDSKTNSDLWILPLEGDKKPRPLLQSDFAESHGQISPDGKWIAYWSFESGQPEIYVRPFPSGAGRWQISPNGGTFPRWRSDSKELYYLSTTSFGQMMAVEVKTSGAAFEYGSARELFNSQYENFSHPGHTGNWHTYAVSNDGQRFLIPRPVSPQTSMNAITVVLNWTALLKK